MVPQRRGEYGVHIFFVLLILYLRVDIFIIYKMAIIRTGGCRGFDIPLGILTIDRYGSLNNMQVTGTVPPY